MSKNRTLAALGLMSGTSLDGVDAAIIYTDGESLVERGPAFAIDYDLNTQNALREEVQRTKVLGSQVISPEISQLSADITKHHIRAVQQLLVKYAYTPGSIDVIGFHGQTIGHNPLMGWSLQIGDPSHLAEVTGINVVSDMRSADMRAGGQGAPIVPLYHQALAEQLTEKPLAVLNLGGVANVTWIGNQGDIIAFDTGPANALINDWVNLRLGQAYDVDGQVADLGLPDEEVVNLVLSDQYFSKPPPKSLDRGDFGVDNLPATLGTEDGAATAVEIIARSVLAGAGHFPSPPRRWLLTGGGRHNLILRERLTDVLNEPVDAVEAVGWRGDFLEAEAMGYLAVRSLLGLPFTLPSTTGCHEPTTGGELTRPKID